MTADTTVNAYLRTKVLTASPEQLRLMLIEGAIRFLRQGREGLAKKDFEASFDGFTKCRNIVVELMTSIRTDVNPELCSRVQGLYTFIYQTIVEGSFEKDLAKVDKAIDMLDYERETWVLTMEKAAEERRAQNPDDAVAPLPTATVHSDRRPLSIQG